MPRAVLAAALFSMLAAPAAAQDAKPAEPAPAPAPLELTAQQDHRRMMEALKIESLRRGADGRNPQAPNAANYDEAKANPYPDLPDPLELKSGEKVTSPEAWWTRRRPEIVEDFDREVYGRVPKDVPSVTWEMTARSEEMVGDVAVVTRKLVGHVDNSACPAITVDIQLTLTTPAAAKGPVPLMMEFGFGGFGARPGGPPRKPAAPNAGRGGTPWQQLVLAKGWGYAILVPASIQADNGAGLTRGIVGLCNKGQTRKPDDWGALRAWAWGASRALDYLETDKAVDARQVGIEGLSRYGKAALVAMAYDPRFAIGFIGSSGEGGAKLHRRNFGELVENLTSSGEYHWMAGNFLKYGGPLTPGDLPVDAHELIALCAPRPTFISYGASTGPGAEGQWVDQRGSFLAAVAAGPVYRLLGKKDLGTTEFPPVETGLTEGELAFRQHSGGHTTGPNWPAFLAFADRYIKVADAGNGDTARRPPLRRPGFLFLELGTAKIDDYIDFFRDVAEFQLLRREGRYAELETERGELLLIDPAMLPEGHPFHGKITGTGQGLGVEIGVVVADLDKAHAAAARHPAWKISSGIVLRPWGVRDFRVLAPDGYYVRFTEPPR
jgi:hypothetical protein